MPSLIRTAALAAALPSVLLAQSGAPASVSSSAGQIRVEKLASLEFPWAVAPLFEQWLEEQFPDRKEKVLNRVREMREGKLYDAKWGVRGRGTGIFAEQMEALFDVTCRRLGLNEEREELSTAHFRRRTAQASLF